MEIKKKKYKEICIHYLSENHMQGIQNYGHVSNTAHDLFP